MKRMFFLVLLLFPLFLIAQKKKKINATGIALNQDLSIIDPRTEQLINPLGIDLLNPRMSWKLKSTKNNTMQYSYEIQVATANDFNAKSIVWTSKKITDQSIYNKYEGSPLLSNTTYFWRATVTDNHGQTAVTPMAFFHTGLLKNEWSAKWIAAYSIKGENQQLYYSPFFRKEFSVSKDVVSATLFISSKGLYEAHINGNRIGNDYLTPGWTSYNNRIQYQAYDLTKSIKKGSNAIAAIVGKGWYKGELGWVNNRNLYGKDLALIAQVMIKLKDGTIQIVGTDESWSYDFGGIQDSEIYHGEQYDARDEKSGWSMPGYSGAIPVKIESTDVKNLIGTYNQTVRKREIIKAQKLIITPEKDTVLDFGQNMVGWVKVKVTGSIGTTIKIQHAEVLDKNGNFYITNLRNAKQANIYTLKGVGEEIFEPHFTFQGWRYIKVSGYPGSIDLNKFEGIALYSDMEKSGSFECSHPLINKLQQNIQWGQRGNFVDVPTDCPQRDERLGWTGDAQAFARTAAYNFDVQNFFAKWLRDLEADQRPNGAIPHVIPNVLGPNAAASTGWADAGTIIPWNMYQIYGDESFLERQYGSMKKWVRYMEDSSKNDLWNHGFHFGDWLFYSIGDDRDGTSAVTDKYLIAQCFYAHSTQLILNAAKKLGKTDDINYYKNLLERIKAAFSKEYVTGSGRLISSTQTAYVLALHFDMLDPSVRSYTAKLLADNIKSYNYHITTGFLGTPYICHVLSRYGYADIAYKLLFQETYPSWLYPVKMGATTIWERWDGIKPDGTFQSASMNSFNHYAYGAIGDWMYRVVCGIELEEPGYKKSIIAPVLMDTMSYAQSSTMTPYGTIASAWKKTIGGVHYSVTVPANTTSTFILTNTSINKVLVNNQVMTPSMVSMEGDKLKIGLWSGEYAIEVRR